MKNYFTFDLKLFELIRLFYFLSLSLFVISCSSNDDRPKAHTKSIIDILILDGKVDVSVERDFEVIAEFIDVDSFRVVSDVKLVANFLSEGTHYYSQYIIPGVAAEKDNQGTEKVYLTLNSEKEKAASIKDRCNFQLKVINRSIVGLSTRYSHYQNIQTYYDKIKQPRIRRKHVWGGSSSSNFEKRHQQRVIDQMKLIDVFENEFDLKSMFNSNNDLFLSELRKFEIGFELDSLFIIGFENEALTVQLFGKWQLFNGFDERILTHPVKIYTSDGYYKQENIANSFRTPELERVVSQAFLSTLTETLLSEEFKRCLTSADEIRKEDSLRNVSLVKLKLQQNPGSTANNRKIKENQWASVAIRGEGSTGSGSIISSEGYILTNYHVIAGIKDNIDVVFSNGKSLKAEIERFDKDLDIALLKIDSTGLFTTTLAPRYKPEVGEKIFTIATPQRTALINTVSFAHVSSLRNIRSIQYIQSDGNFLNGVSGGPLFNENGHQIGMNVWGWEKNGVKVEGINFAIPIDQVIQRLNIQI